MGLFPEASSSSVDSSTRATVSGDTINGGGTPNVRRRLFSAASDILAAVGSSKCVGNVGALKVSDRLTDNSNTTTSTSAATVSFNGTSSSSMQQLSTSWEFLRLVAQMYTFRFSLHNSYIVIEIIFIVAYCRLLSK